MLGITRVLQASKQESIFRRFTLTIPVYYDTTMHVLKEGIHRSQVLEEGNEVP